MHRFWFGLPATRWFSADPQVDATIRQQFYPLYCSMAAVPPAAASPRESVAAVIVLDQFPRNMFRGSPREYDTDAAALTIAQAAIGAGFDLRVGVDERTFLYMPYQHSEDSAVQQRSVALFAALGVSAACRSAEEHKAIVDRFGRFPHRNSILGRPSSPNEVEFLKTARRF